MRTMKKIASMLLLATALFVSGPKTAITQNVCVTSTEMNKVAREAGFVVATELSGTAVKQFIVAYIETTEGLVDAEQVAEILTKIDTVVLYKADDSPVAYVRSFKEGCHVGGFPMPMPLYNAVMKRVELNASN